MKSKRRYEGYLMIDNRNSPGLSEEFLHNMSKALPPGMGLPLGAGCGMFEAPTITCSHCQAVVVLNPLRNRERAYCSGCDHYLCDRCGVTLAQTRECKTFKQVIEEIQEKVVRDTQQGIIEVVDR